MTNPASQMLVHLDATRAAAQRLAAARAIAQRLGSTLTALYAVTPSFIELPFAPEIGPSIAADLVARDEERLGQVQAMFDAAMAGPGPVASWSQTREVPVVGAFSQQALYADLLVLGQHDGGDAASRAVPAHFVPSVLAASGRPAVVIPSIGWSRPIGETVAIAWKETPEAARAVAAALPFLRQAKQVHVLSWAEEQEPAVGGDALSLDGYLRLHGVTPQWHRGGREPGDLGELLLSRVFDLQADLLVMGCYGHGRAREWVLGGASRTLLQSMTLPVLMMH